MGCELDSGCFRLANEVLLRQAMKAALNAGTDVSLSGTGAESGEVVAGLMPEVAAADLLWLRRLAFRCIISLVQACWLLSDHFGGSQSLLGRIRFFWRTAGAKRIAAGCGRRTKSKCP